MDRGLVGDPSLDAAERVDLLHEVPLRHPADRRVAAHVADRVDVEREQERALPCLSEGVRRLAACVAAADDDGVEVEVHGLVRVAATGAAGGSRPEPLLVGSRDASGNAARVGVNPPLRQRSRSVNIAARHSQATKKKMAVGEYDERPWGNYLVLDEADGFKVKRICVKGQSRLSYQRHQHRQEHWFVVQGVAHVTIDGEVHEVPAGAAIDIPLRARTASRTAERRR